MDEFVLRTKNLTKDFGIRRVLNNVNISIRKGDIYGFIGPNGAGKTTAMKVVLGLLTPTSGEVELFGRSGDPAVLKRVGSLIESPGLYKNCTALENMSRFAILTHSGKDEIMNLLRSVGLELYAGRKVNTFSLGMKQRLGIAIALMGAPEFLILDEPVNALDPQGMVDVRNIIQNINSQFGVTFFISSHHIGELEKICSVYGIINNGILTEELNTKEIISRLDTSIFIRCQDPMAAAKAIKEKIPQSVIDLEVGALTVSLSPERSAEVNRILMDAGIPVSELFIRRQSFEDFLLRRMGIMNPQGNVYNAGGVYHA